jgi:hypothetical protein
VVVVVVVVGRTFGFGVCDIGKIIMAVFTFVSNRISSSVAFKGPYTFTPSNYICEEKSLDF